MYSRRTFLISIAAGSGWLAGCQSSDERDTATKTNINTTTISKITESPVNETEETTDTEPRSLEISCPNWIETGGVANIRVKSDVSPVNGAKIGYRFSPFFSDTWSQSNSYQLSNENGLGKIETNQPGDYEIRVQSEGYESQPDVLFESRNPKTEDWYFRQKIGTGESKYVEKTVQSPLRINTYPQEIGKTFVRPRIKSCEKKFKRWDDYTLSFSYKFQRLDGGFHISLRRCPRGRYWITLDEEGNMAVNKTYPVREYEDQENVTKQEFHLASGSANLTTPKVWHDVEIKVEGNSLHSSIDGQTIIEYADQQSNKPAGSFQEGIFEFETHENVDILIKNLRVKEIPPEPTISSEIIRAYPKGNPEMPIRGAKDKGIPFEHLRFNDARTLGANWVARVHSHWIDTDTYSINPHEPERKIRDYIAEAKCRGLNVYYTPHLWWENEPVGDLNDIPSSERESFLNNATDFAVQRATFAENQGVEMFAPLSNLQEFLPHEATVEWYAKIVPMIREVYSGKIIKGKNPLNRGIENTEYDFSRYDYVSINANPSGSYSDYRQKVQDMIKTGKKWSNKYGVKGIIVPFMGGDSGEKFVKKELEKGKTIGEIKARFHEIFLQETMGEIDGVFLDSQWSEKFNAKLYSRQLENENLSHSTAWFWGYQGPEIANTIKKFYSVSG